MSTTENENETVTILTMQDNNKRSYTATGYGTKLHTGKTITGLYKGKKIKRDIFIAIYSNIGTLYIVLDYKKHCIESAITDFEIKQLDNPTQPNQVNNNE